MGVQIVYSRPVMGVHRNRPSIISCEYDEIYNGFGIAVIQRLCKSSVKKNLYWEIKDRVIEESFNGMHANRRSTKVKVYGVNSTKEVRARLIELLMERVRYHKDKFVAPILHHEMSAMQVKKSGRVEHSDNSHDDQVFSYLMALYVWYDGKNLAENFHIIKNTLRTDADEDLEELEMEDALEKREQLNVDKFMYDPDDEKVADLNETLAWVERDAKTYMDSDMFAQKQRDELYQMKADILAKDPNIRQTLIDQTGVDNQSYMNQGNPYVTIPSEVFGLTDDEDDFDWEDDNYGIAPRKKNSYLAGNLAGMFNDDYF